MTPILSIRGLSHVYSAGTPFEKVAVDNINLDIPEGQFLGLIGHTGSGKSTLIQHFNGLLKPTSGSVLLNGEDIHSSKENLRNSRFTVGLVFQYPEYQLFEETVFRDIAFGPKNMKLPENEIEERVREAASFVGVPEDIFERSPLELSGGQKRRVAIAGVIAMRPHVLVLDEPTAGLDPAGRESILRHVQKYRDATGCTVILVTHNMDDIARIADRLVVMSSAKIAMDGTPSEIFIHSEELTGMGLSVPESSQIASRLRELGADLPDSIFTSEQLVSAILKAKGAR